MARKKKSPEQLFESWIGGVGRSCKEKLTTEVREKCIDYMSRMSDYLCSNEKSRSRYREHLVSFVMYDVPGDWFEKSISLVRGTSTHFRMMTLYGEIEGEKRYEQYHRRQTEMILRNYGGSIDWTNKSAEELKIASRSKAAHFHDEIINLAAQGKSMTEINETLGFGYNSVYRYVTKNNINFAVVKK